MVHDEPVVTEVSDDCLEFAEINWFLDIAVHAQPVTIHQIALFARGGHDDDGNGLGPGIFFELAENFEAIELGEIEKNNFGRVVELALGIFSATKKKVQSFFAVASDVDFVGEIVFTKHTKGEFDVVGIVFDEEDFNFVHERLVGAAKGSG